MTATSRHRGHPIRYDVESDCWRYIDSGQGTVCNPNRRCGVCNQEDTPEGHDPCLGTLPCVLNACCGHGEDNCAYVQFPDGSDIRGIEAIEYFRGVKQCQN
ncbi:hypothetical protein Pan241w_11340 [Gimesia alba]|uniref:Uncharacterized protein n=1 Tax=Gimesia alba TaxID=2527973 RepID=A0A517RB13_9PLAN|nr:hypothetical protein Pan241w_11340 [Gimesia alba]